MKVVIPAPDHPYYLWQVLAQSVALEELGQAAQYLMYTGRQGPPSKELLAMMGQGAVDTIVWNDWRDRPTYNPAMKPWLVGRWLEAKPELVDEPFLLIDPDAIPTGKRRVPTPSPERWFATDTDTYTGPEYLRTRKGGEKLWEQLCALVGVDPEVAGAQPGVGAQYAVVGQDHDFWYTVAEKSIDAYALLETFREGGKAHEPAVAVSGVAHDEPRPNGQPVQSWCAEMYVMQLEAARRNIVIRPSAPMSMVWADGKAEDWETAGFFHDAGVVAENGRDFSKTSWQKGPFGSLDKLEVDPESASAPYVDLLRRTLEKYPELARMIS